MKTTKLSFSDLDTVSGQEMRVDGTKKPERVMTEYLTIQEAAKRCGVSDKTIQRAIRAGKLLAQYPLPNRCEIALGDLDTFMHGQVSGQDQEATERRLVALEQRIRQLESLVEELRFKQTAPQPPSRAKGRERTTGLLPKQFVSLLAFARHHNVAEAMVQTHMDMGVLPVKRGAWTEADGTKITLALDAKGRAAFYQMYRYHAHFMSCNHCPHGYQDSVSGQG